MSKKSRNRLRYPALQLTTRYHATYPPFLTYLYNFNLVTCNSRHTSSNDDCRCRPEYVALWLGLAKIGVTVALINYNLRSKSLVHTLTIGECRAVIYGLELESGQLQI